MAVSLPNGALIHIGSAYGSALAVSGITNANPAVATSAAHGLANGDYVTFSSGWSRLNNRTFRVANVTVNTFDLEGIDTTSTTTYPAGSGSGTVKKVTTWTQIQQVLNTATSGGEQQFTEFQFLEADAATSIPTAKSAARLAVTVADDPTLAGYIAAKAANDDRSPRALRLSLPNGAKIAYYAYVSMAASPSLTANEVMALEMTATFLNPDPSRYAS